MFLPGGRRGQEGSRACFLVAPRCKQVFGDDSTDNPAHLVHRAPVSLRTRLVESMGDNPVRDFIRADCLRYFLCRFFQPESNSPVPTRACGSCRKCLIRDDRYGDIANYNELCDDLEDEEISGQLEELDCVGDADANDEGQTGLREELDALQRVSQQRDKTRHSYGSALKKLERLVDLLRDPQSCVFCLEGNCDGCGKNCPRGIQWKKNLCNYCEDSVIHECPLKTKDGGLFVERCNYCWLKGCNSSKQCAEQLGKSLDRSVGVGARADRVRGLFLWVSRRCISPPSHVDFIRFLLTDLAFFAAVGAVVYEFVCKAVEEKRGLSRVPDWACTDIEELFRKQQLG